MNGTELYTTPEFYDAVYAGITADIAPWVAEARAAGGPVLEVACGTGRLLVPTLQAGVACDGLDVSEVMLAAAREKLAARGLRARLFAADMRDFSLPHRYAMVGIGFSSFLHNLTQADQLHTLRCCRAHLENGGALHLVHFHPSVRKIVELGEGETPGLVGTWPGSDDVMRTFELANDDRIEQVRRVRRRFERVAPDGRVTEQRTFEFSLRWVWKPEMELLLATAGFSRWDLRALAGGYGGPAALRPEGDPVQEGDILWWTAWKD